MKTCCHIVLIDNDEDEAELLKEVIREKELPFAIEYFLKKDDAEAYLTKTVQPDVIMLDVEPGNNDWKNWLAKVQAIPGLLEVPVVIYTTVYDWEVEEHLLDGKVIMQPKPTTGVGYKVMLDKIYSLCKTQMSVVTNAVA